MKFDGRSIKTKAIGYRCGITADPFLENSVGVHTYGVVFVLSELQSLYMCNPQTFIRRVNCCKEARH